MEVISKHRDGDATPIIKVKPDASSEVSALIVKMMAVNPKARLQSMVAVRDEVKRLLESLASAET